MKTITHSKPFIDTRDRIAVSRILKSGHLTASGETRLFESEFARACGQKHAAAVSSGTAALALSLYALGLSKGAEVIIPSYVCSAVLNAVLFVNATPVLVDLAPNQYTLSPYDVKKKLTRKTKAVIVPHLFGQPADVREIVSYGVPVIEDCAQTLLASAQGRQVGQWGELMVCSFYATKLLATGEGGMALSRNNKYIARIKDYIEYDEKNSAQPRFNFKTTDLQSALGRSQLKKLSLFIQQRKKIAIQYTQALQSKNISLPGATTEAGHMYFRYVIGNIKNMPKKMRAFEKLGIMARNPIFKPLHHYLKQTGFPETEKAWKNSLSLPLYPSLDSADASRIIKAAQRIL